MRRDAGWLPQDHGDLEAWLTGHRERVKRLINEVLTMAPEFGQNSVIIPLGAIFDWTMGTPAGFAAFRDPRINAMLKKILNVRCDFLDSADSLYVLNDSPSGWMCTEARRAIGIERFDHDPDDEHWGFKSWNHFFTLRFKDGQRPVAAPDDAKVIVSACESTPYRIATGIRRHDRFWIKSQPIRYRTCWPTTSRLISSSAAPSIRRI